MQRLFSKLSEWLKKCQEPIRLLESVSLIYAEKIFTGSGPGKSGIGRRPFNRMISQCCNDIEPGLCDVAILSYNMNKLNN